MDQRDKYFTRWEKRRGKRWKHFLKYGVLFALLGAGIKLYQSDFDPYSIEIENMLMHIGSFFLGGLVLGAINYQGRERAYKRWKEDSSKNE